MFVIGPAKTYLNSRHLGICYHPIHNGINGARSGKLEMRRLALGRRAQESRGNHRVAVLGAFRGWLRVGDSRTLKQTEDQAFVRMEFQD